MATGELASPLPSPALRALEAEYEFLREVGRGGMATVYLARARASGRVVAIKTVATHRAHDPEAVARFAREARTVLSLDHPNIVRSYSVENLEDGALAIVMQHAGGGTLREALREAQRTGEAIPVERVASILADVAAALAHAHERGVVHRDVKPENIFLDPRNGRALLSDFGIARSLDGDNALTMTGSAIGTPTYMSPEQIDGLRVDGRSDVYALGLVGWEMLAGARPWEGDSLYTVIYKQKHEALAPLALVRPDVPAPLRAAIERALRKDPADRWPDAATFEGALRDALPDALPAPAAAPAPSAAPMPTELRDAGDVFAEGGRDEHLIAPTAADVGLTAAAVENASSTEGTDGPIAIAATADSGAVALPATIAHVADIELPPAELPTTSGRLSWRAVRRLAGQLGARYRAAPPGLHLAVPLALAVVAALAVRQGTRHPPLPRIATADTSLTLPAAGDVATLDTSASPSPPTRRARAGGAAVPAATNGAAGRRAGSAANSGAASPPAARAPMGLARFARTHGDSLALCRSAAARDQRACFTALLFDRDARLNAAYVRLVRELRGRDAAAIAPLRAEELRWMQERDVTCARDGRGREGALWAPSRAACLGDAADRRAADLTARLERLRAR